MKNAKIQRLSDVKKLTFRRSPELKRAVIKVGLRVQAELELDRARHASRLSRSGIFKAVITAL
jgi:hypothetical protein